MLAEFIIQNKFFSFTLEEFGQILSIPIEGQCSFSDKWSLDNLEYNVPSGGPYQTTPPTPEDIKLYVQVVREEPVTRIRHGQIVNVEENQILTREVQLIKKTWVKIIRENVFCLGGNLDHVSALIDMSCMIVSCILSPLNISERRKRILARKEDFTPPLFLLPLIIHHIDDDNDENDEAPKWAKVNREGHQEFVEGKEELPPKLHYPIPLTIIPIRKLFVDLTQEDDETHTLSPIEKSSSPSPPNAPSTKETSSTFRSTSSSFKSKLHSSPFSSRNTPSPQPTNLSLDDPLDAPLRHPNPLSLQSYPSLDITLSLSPITPLDQMLETPSPSLPPPPQPPLMAHPIFFNVLDYHGAHFLCCFHN
ncbi:hypothetical protein Tco_0627283 [Tanacetum coccineum]|uniref:Uncharacterized protein n=1 Tax=Tanacetum coccineum TaxID=301880 RepID=A0ABQ4WLZ6_9ASTR